MSTHTIKHIALPAGWEKFKIAETEHPGKGWLTVAEFAKIMGISVPRANAILNSDKTLQKCKRLVRGHNINYYKPAGK